MENLVPAPRARLLGTDLLPPQYLQKDPCESLQLVLLSVGPLDEVLKNTKVGHLNALQLMQWQKSGTLTRVSVTDTWGQRREKT